jgi:6-phosphogluconolactonase (cycloisomerase 2 family)
MVVPMRRFLVAALLLLVSAACAAPADAAQRALFASQAYYSPGMRSFKMDVETGALTLQPGTAAVTTYPSVPGISPDGSRLYVADYFADAIHGYAVDQPAAALSELAGSPWPTGAGPNTTVVSSSGTALWTAGFTADSISGFTIGSGLTALAGSPFAAAGGPNSIAISPNNPFLYATGNTGSTLDGYSRAADGTLTALAGFPMSIPAAGPIDPEFSADGTLLFVADNATNDIHSYRVDQATGALGEATGSPFAAGSAPGALAATPDGKWLFVADQGDDTVRGFAVSSDGVLTPAGGPVSTVALPYDLTVSPNSRFLYAAGYNSGTIGGFAIGADGSLSGLPGSPFGDVAGPLVSLAIVPDQGPVAALSARTAANTNNVTLDASGSTDPDGTVASYRWQFGDGTGATTTSPQTTHTYRAGQYAASVTVTDDENCSDRQIGTGQTLACNGSSAATAGAVAVVPPLELKYPSGKQIKSARKGHKTIRRVRVQYFLNRAANVTFQFQKSKRRGACKKKTVKRKRRAKFKNFGKRSTHPGVVALNQRVFNGKFGGRKIVPGRYRVQLKAKDAVGDETGTVTSASFCVR